MNEENANEKQVELSEQDLKEVIMTSASRMQPSRHTMLHSLGTVALPLIYCVGAKSAPAQPVAPLWDSASILLGNGGILLGPDVAQCPLFDTNGRALENGTATSYLR